MTTNHNTNVGEQLSLPGFEGMLASLGSPQEATDHSNTAQGTINVGAAVIHFPAEGTWNGDGGSTYFGPEGTGLANNSDTFVANHSQYGLIAFVGPNPLYDSTGAYRWHDGTGYFPRLAETDGGTNGYWWVGTNGVFTSDRTGTLWFGFNDDGVIGPTYDNVGAVFGDVTITH